MTDIVEALRRLGKCSVGQLSRLFGQAPNGGGRLDKKGLVPKRSTDPPGDAESHERHAPTASFDPGELP